MKLLKIVVIPLLIGCYLYLSYIRFYHFIGDINLRTPYLVNLVTIENREGKGSVKYVALGDSLSAGVGSQDIIKTFVYQYGVKLSEKYSKVSLLNLAWPGDMAEDVLNNQLPKAIEEKPDFITLLIGTNDIHNKKTEKDFQEKYQYILNQLLTKTNASIIVLTIPYLGSNKLVYPPFNFLLDYRTKQFNKIILTVVGSVSDKERIKLVDLYKETYVISKRDINYYSSDLFHPSGEGYLLWGRIINAN
jgi:lysophospholipase L1-like esterase